MELTDDQPTPELAVRVLTAALARRGPGEPARRELPPVEALRAQVDDLAGLLLELGPGEWEAPTLAGFTVRDLVGHLLAVEGYVADRLDVAPPPGLEPFVIPPGLEEDHRAMTVPTIEARAGDPPEALVADWQAWVGVVLDHLSEVTEADLDARFPLHQLDLSLRSLIGVRVFELWTHTEDIRRATGRDQVRPGADQLRFMSDLAVGALPLGLLLAGIDDPGRTLRVVLTGEGGGEWLQALSLDAEPGPPDASLEADVVDFCRLAAQRLTPVELAHRSTGDEAVVRDVLVGAAVFAA